MISFLRSAYHRLVSRRRRRAIYCLLHAREMKGLRTAVFPSAKGTFSLRRCDDLRAIFVHTPKAAGTSVAISIFGELPYHYTADDYKAIFGRATFREYFTFTFVRNPWDRVSSAYHFLMRGGWDAKDKAWAQQHLNEYEDFRDFVRRGLGRQEIQEYMHFRHQSDFVCDASGNISVDFVGYFETIDSDFRRICTIIGIDASLAHTNKGDERDYREAFDDETRQIVAEVYADDIATFGYAFDGIRQRVACAVATSP